MKTILITDTHFGVKQNSMTWLNSQADFLENQLIPYIKQFNKQEIRLVHLGDVFDSRSTISTYVAARIIKIFKELNESVNEFIIIGGNHDYYSPNSDEVDTINLLFGDLGIKLVTKDSYVNGKDIFVPWYQWEDHQEELQNDIKEYNIKNVFTHADIVTSKVNIKGCNIYSGHIHIPYIKNKIRNLGSCYALNFADANAPRGFYVLEDEKLQFIENEKSIKFYRLYNEDIFKDINHLKSTDYIELYISQSNLSKHEYNDRITYLTKKHKYIWVIPQATILEAGDEIKFEGYDVAAITRDLIPENLKDKFEIVVSSIVD